MSARRTVVESVLAHADRDGSSPAVVAGDDVVTYGELRGRIVSAAALLHGRDVARGDRVVLSATRGPEFVVGYLATHLLGAVAVPLEPDVPRRQFGRVVERIRPRAVFGDTPAMDHDLRLPLEELRSSHRELDAVPLPGPADVADVLFTSGTSGRPKGVVLTHGNLAAQAENIGSMMTSSNDDREIMSLPLGHSFGLGRLRSIMAAGATMVLVDGLLRIADLFEAMDRWNATGLGLTPAGVAIVLRLTRDKLADYADQLRYVEMGSAPMERDNKLRLMQLLPSTRLCMHYGLTEASRATFIDFHRSADKLDSIGKPAGSTKVRIDAVPCAAGRHDREGGDGQVLGEVMISGDVVLKEYWDDPAETARVLTGGWLRTGDMGYQDESGFLYLSGRREELINVGGMKVSPVEIEGVLDAHEGIEESACLGVPDESGIMGETVKAYLVAGPAAPKPSDRELTEFLRARLEAYKVPVAFEWTDRIPRTSSGKPRRGMLRDGRAFRPAADFDTEAP